MKTNLKIFHLFALILLLSLVPADSFGQFYFGKNKVQYTQFNWQVMETEHFNIYFYDEEEEVAKMAARIAEDAYRDLAAKFNFEPRKKTPLILLYLENF